MNGTSSILRAYPAPTRHASSSQGDYDRSLPRPPETALQDLIDQGLSAATLSALTEAELAAMTDAGSPLIVARVAYAAHGHLQLRTPNGVTAGLSHGALRDDPPVVGDWVVATTDSDPWIATRLLPRSGTLRRRDPDKSVQLVATHVDVALLCTAMGRDLNPRRTERWLALAREAGVQPVVVLTKCDAGTDTAAALASLRSVWDGPLFAVSALDGIGLDAVRDALPSPCTGALLGSSGVGKSTLLNALINHKVQETGGVRGDQKGRHTTTARSLHPLPWGAWVIDNPGVREVGLVSEAGVGETFDDVETLASDCAWRDCRHEGDNGCALAAAVAAGTMKAGRVAGWKKLQREAAAQVERRAKEAQTAARRKLKQRRAKPGSRPKSGGKRRR